MSNEFINYLNSMNNATGDNINALAESQVSNKYYQHIMVERKLGKNIVNDLKRGNKNCYIISGYAGDGKTSILVQILKELNLLDDEEGLKIQDIKEFSQGKLMYVKDMSELSKTDQKNLLKKALEAPENGMSSILISNTGPLINSFKNLFCKEGDDKKTDELENILLKQLDENINKEIEIQGKSFKLINIARLDNIGFVREVVGKICNDILWEACEKCGNSEKCPICVNQKSISLNLDRVIEFIENYYKWLKENDKRITIRQMISQITFAMTGNLKCEEIKKFDESYNKFTYNFANLFFGYRGVAKLEEARQIKSISILQDAGFDQKSLIQDYEMFVKNDFSMLSDDIKNLVETIWKKFSKKVYLCDEDDNKIAIEQQNIRMSIRRFVLMYGNFYGNNSNSFYENLYSKAFTDYSKLISEKMSSKELKNINDKIFKAIYIKNLGVPPKGNTLYLTLRKDDEITQNVFLLLAKVEAKKIKLVQEVKDTEIDDIEEAYIAKLIINEQKQFIITLPLLEYFYSIVEGEISTDIDPSLSHGLDKFNSLLINTFRDSENEEEMGIVVVDSKNKVKNLTITLDGGEILF